MAYNWTTEWPGVYAQHASDCPLRSGGDCTCQQITYRASAKAPDERSRVLSPEFGSAIDARNWLRDQRARVTAATAVADEGPSLAGVIRDFLAAAGRGLDRNGAGPGASHERLRQVSDGLGYIGTELGGKRIQSVRRRDIQALVDQLHAAGVPADRINGVIGALRVLFSYAIQRDLVDFNPIVQLRLPDAQIRMDTPMPQPQPQPQAADLSDLTAYYSGNGNGNGNGNHGGTDYGEPTAPYTPAFTAPFAPPVPAGVDESSDYWRPGVFDQFEFGDDPFSTEPPPPAVPRAPWVASDPLQADPYPPEQYPTEPAFAPPAAAMPPAAPPMPTPTPMPPPPPMQTPQPMPTAQTPLPPSQAYVTTETRYGTPTYGTESVTTTQAPAQSDSSADNVMLSEQMFWWITRIVVIVFVLIALVLAAESV
jgi:hypothetical protein